MGNTTSSQADDTPASVDPAIESALAQARSGQVVSYEAVRAWLLSWGTDTERPAPPCP